MKILEVGYRGGFTYCNPKYKEKIVGKGVVLDVNSLYPSILYGCNGEVMPYRLSCFL